MPGGDVFPVLSPPPASGVRKADLVLHNARLFLPQRTGPEATLVSAVGDRVQWVGGEGDLDTLRGPRTRVIDCEGWRVVPGFIDAHAHLFAYAANLGAVDCSPQGVSSIADIQRTVRERADAAGEGAWLRAWGYDEFQLAEGRAPTRWELDEAAPRNPVKLSHRSGHASVLNSAALRVLGIGNETPEAIGATIERDATGELTGYLQEMEVELAARGGPCLSPIEVENLLGQAFQQLLSLGVTSLQDATPDGALDQWDSLDELRRRGRLPLRVTKMVGTGDLGALAERELGYGGGDAWLSVGPAKIMLNETGQPTLPEAAELLEMAWPAHAAGYQIAFHAVEEGGLTAAAEAVEGLLRLTLERTADVAGGGLRLHDHRHRVEHCGVCPPELARRLRAAGVVVVAQPGFVREHGDRYLQQVDAERQAWLHPLRSLVKGGLHVALGSDMPVAPPGPIAAIGGAVTRLSRRGAAVNATEAVDAAMALRLHTEGGAYAAADEHLKGSIAPGQLADLVVLDGDPLTAEPAALGETGVVMTVVGGRVAYEA